MSPIRKHNAHFQAFGYEPLRMKPAHFASGFFIALTGEVFRNQLLNEVAVVGANKGLLDSYRPEAVLESLKTKGLVPAEVPQAAVEMLRVQINGIVDNDRAMFPAFRPYRPKGNDYTFISRRVLTVEGRTDGYAGYFVSRVLDASEQGQRVLEEGRRLANEPLGTLEQLVQPLIAEEMAQPKNLAEEYEEKFGTLMAERLNEIATRMVKETDALARLCNNFQGYSPYKRVRFYVIGLQAWLISYLVKTAAAVRAASPIFLFDFSGVKDGPTRIQSKSCYARLRETVGRSYLQFAQASRFDPDPIAEGLFNKRSKQGRILEEDFDFTFLEQHFSDMALRIGYAQPRASSVSDKHFELQPDTLRVLMLSLLPSDTHQAMKIDEVYEALAITWCIVVGGNTDDLERLREQGYFGLDEEDLRANSEAFVCRLKSLNFAVEPSDGLVLCATNIEEMV
jgi:hypothetical protein